MRSWDTHQWAAMLGQPDWTGKPLMTAAAKPAGGAGGGGATAVLAANAAPP